MTQTRLLKTLNNDTHTVSGFADDVACCNASKNLDTAVTNANINAKNVSIWLENHGLKVNPDKCVAIYFNKSKNWRSSCLYWR